MAQIYRWFMQDVPQMRMGIARILLGFCFLGAYLVRAPYAQFLYGAHGFAGLDFYDIVGTKERFSYGLGMWLVLFGSDTLVYILYGLLLFSAFCFMIGFKARYFGILIFFLHIAFDQRNYIATAGWAKIAHCFLFYILVSRGGDVLSVDAWWKNRRSLTPAPQLLGPAWPMRLLQIHVCTMYFVSSWPRLNQEMWTKGHVVTWTLLHTEYSRFNANFLAMAAPLKAVDWMALAVEPFAAVALWLPVIGPLWAVALCGMHIMLELTTHVDWWNFMMLAGLMMFIPEEWLRKNPFSFKARS